VYGDFGKDEDFSDRDWFINPMKTGKVYVTDFYVSKITKALCITVSAPLIDDQDEIVGIFSIDMKFEALVKMEEQFEDWLGQPGTEADQGKLPGQVPKPAVDTIE
jgi:hypothetical protein